MGLPMSSNLGPGAHLLGWSSPKPLRHRMAYSETRSSTQKLCRRRHAPITAARLSKRSAKGRQKMPHLRTRMPKAHSTGMRSEDCT